MRTLLMLFWIPQLDWMQLRDQKLQLRKSLQRRSLRAGGRMPTAEKLEKLFPY
jgi:hypothetical protein